jgi:osmotically-inducible protein OsmY
MEKIQFNNNRTKKVGWTKFLVLWVSSLILLFVYSCEPDKGESFETSDMIQLSSQDQNQSITDKEITQAIERELIIQDGVLAYKIDVETQEGVVKLMGTTDNILAKDRATDIARMVKGVNGVVNLVKVKHSNIPDSELKQNIEKALLQDPATDSYEVSVEVNNGVVDLSGVVESWQEKKTCK